MSDYIQVRLSEEQRQYLLDITNSGKHLARTHKKARLLLLSDWSQGTPPTDQQVADAVGVDRRTVMRARRRLATEGLEAALVDKPRPGPAPRITGEVEAKLLSIACSEPPEGRDSWTLRLLANEMLVLEYVDYISHVSVRHRLNDNQLKPWQVRSWCIGKPSASYVAKMEDVLDVYARPYDPLRPVVCVDEKSKELRSTPRGSLPAQPATAEQAGQKERQDYEYARHGTCNIFLSVEPLAGRRRTRVSERRTYQDFAEELRLISDEDYPDAEVIVLVTDNLNTHGPACLYETFAPTQARRLAQRFEWHYTPEHGSWLNMAEIELSVLGRQCLNRRLAATEEVARHTRAWHQARNAQHAAIRWQFRTADARIKLRRLYPQIQQQRPARHSTTLRAV